MKIIPQPTASSSASGTEESNKNSKRKSQSGRKVNQARARRGARERVLQALYQWDLAKSEAHAVKQEILLRQEMDRVDVEYFNELFDQISADLGSLDRALQATLDRPIEDLDPIERGVLRIACYELGQRLDIPVKVVINEAVEITKRFGADQGHKYVNGVLDKLALSVRGTEMQNHSRARQ